MAGPSGRQTRWTDNSPWLLSVMFVLSATPRPSYTPCAWRRLPRSRTIPHPAGESAARETREARTSSSERSIKTDPLLSGAKEQFTGFGYAGIAGRIGAQGGHRPQVPAPPLRRGQLEDTVGERGQEFVLPGAALLGGQSWGSAGACCCRGGHRMSPCLLYTSPSPRDRTRS